MLPSPLPPQYWFPPPAQSHGSTTCQQAKQNQINEHNTLYNVHTILYEAGEIRIESLFATVNFRRKLEN